MSLSGKNGFVCRERQQTAKRRVLLLASILLLAIVALSSGMYERESTAKHGTARNRTALRRAVELAKRLCLFCIFQAINSWVRD